LKPHSQAEGLSAADLVLPSRDAAFDVARNASPLAGACLAPPPSAPVPHAAPPLGGAVSLCATRSASTGGRRVPLARGLGWCDTRADPTARIILRRGDDESPRSRRFVTYAHGPWEYA
jgi:hypothetical protein